MSRFWMVLWAVGCAGTSAETTPSPPPAAEAPAVAEPAPVDVPEPDAAAPAAAPAVVVDAHRQVEAGSVAVRTPVAVAATPGVNRIDVVIDHLVSYCAPAPSFTAALAPEALELTLVRPDGVSRCFGAHHVEAHVDLPGRNGLRKVVVRDAEGEVLAEAPIASGE